MSIFDELIFKKQTINMKSTPQSEPILIEESQVKPSNKSRLFPTFIDLVVIFAAFIAAQIASVLVVKKTLPLIISSSAAGFVDSLTILLAQVIAMSLTIAFIAFLRSSRSAKPSPMRFSLRGFDPTILLAGVLMLLSMGVVLEPLLSLLPAPPAISQRGWPMLVAIVLAAPFFEEIICRGLIYESMRAKWGVVVAWLGSSLFFALMHLDAAMVINAFFMGLILCYIYIRTRSLIAPMILHAINNGLAFLLILLGLGGDDGNVMLSDLIASQRAYWIIYIVAVLILIVAVLLCVGQFKAIIAASTTQDREAEGGENKSA
ncbi:MAG: type II CAAX endopeptidase family protein [Rikenellaceae bacterium]